MVSQVVTCDTALMEATTTVGEPRSERSTLSHYRGYSIGKEDSAAGHRHAFTSIVVSFEVCRESWQCCGS